MNYAALSEGHGAPLRLRVENQLGYKMVKWVCKVEFLETHEHLGKGSKDQRLLALYQQLHDELSLIIEDPSTGSKLKSAIGERLYTHIVELLVAATELE